MIVTLLPTEHWTHASLAGNVLSAWMRVMQSRPLPASIRLPSVGARARPADKAAVRAKKNQRKAARTARKRNR